MSMQSIGEGIRNINWVLGHGSHDYVDNVHRLQPNSECDGCGVGWGD